ncbi:hypothetical protein D3C74_175140 [compost metagenome]
MIQYALYHPYLTALMITTALLITGTVLNNLINTIAATKRGEDDADSRTNSH